MAVDRAPGVDTWSFGMFLCMRESEETAIIEDVVPHETVGSGFEPVGTGIHEFTFSSGESGTISVEGFPPPTAIGLVPVKGYALDVVCSNPGPDRVAELIVGLRVTADDGGGWLGADVSYSVADRDYVLEIRNEMLICGESVVEFCDGADPS
jgi:hypothetical protein